MPVCKVLEAQCFSEGAVGESLSSRTAHYPRSHRLLEPCEGHHSSSVHIAYMFLPATIGTDSRLDDVVACRAGKHGHDYHGRVECSRVLYETGQHFPCVIVLADDNGRPVASQFLHKPTFERQDSRAFRITAWIMALQ